MMDKSEATQLAMRGIQSTYEDILIRGRARDAAAKELQGIVELKKSRPQTPEFVQLEVDSQSRASHSDSSYRKAVIELVHGLLDFQSLEGASVSIDGQTIQLRSVEKISRDGVEISVWAPGIGPMILPDDIVITPGPTAGALTVKIGDEPPIFVPPYEKVSEKQVQVPPEASPVGQ